LSGSDSALYSVIFSLFSIFFINNLKNKFVWIMNKKIFYVSVFSFICIFYYCILNLILIYDFSFSGRLNLWTNAISGFGNKIAIWHGVGLGGFRDEYYLMFGRAVSAHNSFVEYYFSFGVFGLIFLISTLVVLFKNSALHAIYNNNFLYLSILLFIILKALTSSNLGYVSFETIVVFLIYLVTKNSLLVSNRKHKDILRCID